MLKLFKLISVYIKQIVTIFLFVVSGVLIVYMLPRERKFDLEYSVGSPWKYDNLTANFSFSIYKTEAELQREKDSLLKKHYPYFTFDATVVSDNISAFNNDFTHSWLSYTLDEYKIENDSLYYESSRYLPLRNLQEHYASKILSLLENVYFKGIVEEPSPQEINMDKIHTINILKGNISDEVKYNSLYSVKSAYQYITAELKKEMDGDRNRQLKRYSVFFNEFDINKYLAENITYNAEKNQMEKAQVEKGISLTKGIVQEGELIISRGLIVSQETYQILQSYKRDYAEQFGTVNTFIAWAGRIILVGIALFVLYLFLMNFRKEVLQSIVKTSFILFMIVMMVFIGMVAYKWISTTKSYNFNHVTFYLVPFAILPIILRTFYDDRVALFIHIITILLSAFFADNRFEFVFLNIIAGMVAIFSLTNLYHRSRFFLAALFVIFAYSITYTGMLVIKDGTLSPIKWINYRDFTINGILILLSFLLIFIFEKTFGFLSDTTLMELSDTNQPLLRRLAENAPATFQHSLQVANLSEEAIRHIGGNPMLVRTGALYHDIGKMIDASYFTENQGGGPNPHANKDLKESARIIIDHVNKGKELAKKHKLPEAIISFIMTHHGTSTAKYFYKTYQNQHPDEDVEKKDFQYPGPRPMSKENAVLMMADTVEAASRSLENYTKESISELVERLINTQIDEGQFEDADITFKDIKKVKEVFKDRLNTIYHARIAYPK
jgi:cyclic-di-AMP phosphodiesterase PgpH